MSTRAELEHAILTQPQSDARDAAYLDWLQEFAPEDLALARAGLFHDGLRLRSCKFDAPVIAHARTGRAEFAVADFDLLQAMRLAFKNGFVLRFGSHHYLALLGEHEVTSDTRGELAEIRVVLLLHQYSQP